LDLRREVGEVCLMRNLIFAFFTFFIWIISRSVISRIRQISNAHKILVGKLSGSDHLEVVSVGGKIVLNGSLRNSAGVVEWIYLPQDRDQ
jgi:hypothetical protein